MLDNGKGQWLDFDSYRLHRRRRILEKNGEHVRLTPRVFDLLCLLVERAGETVSKEELLENVWADAIVEEGNINRTVSTLRKHLGRQSDGTDFIETVPRVGYRFLADVRAEVATAERVESNANQDPVETSRRVRRGIWTAVGLLAIVAMGFSWWKFWPTATAKPSISKKNTMEKLLDTPEQDISPAFASDGRILFGKYFEDRSVQMFSMAADGSDVRPKNEISSLSYGRWSPDGSKVFFSKQAPDRRTYLANADGSDEQVMPFFAGNSNWSSDGKLFLYQATAIDSEIPNNADLYIYSLETGVSTRVVEGPAFDGDPSFSPDGGSIAFVSDREGNFEIYSMDLATKEGRRLTDDPAHDSFPTFSPDGTQIIFNSDREKENTDVYLMNVDGSGLRKITDNPGWDTAPPNCWSPDGTKVLLLSDKDGDEDIYVMEIEPYAPRKVIDEKLSGTAFPSYSPDGRSIVYQRRDGEDSEVRVFDVASSTSRLLTRAIGGELYPSFSPDGALILFQEKLGDNTEISTIRVDGTGRTNLTNSHAKDMHASFSPDGKTIVFSSNRGGSSSDFEIYLMNADGSDQRQVFGDHAMSLNPTFTPDGKSILFTNDREGGRIGNFEIFSIPAEGGTETRLTNRRRADSQQSVSPDGTRVVFSSTTDGNSEIYVMNIDGRHLIRLTRDLAEDSCPRWSPDGPRIIFSSDRGGTVAVYEIEL